MMHRPRRCCRGEVRLRSLRAGPGARWNAGRSSTCPRSASASPNTRSSIGGAAAGGTMAAAPDGVSAPPSTGPGSAGSRPTCAAPSTSGRPSGNAGRPARRPRLGRVGGGLNDAAAGLGLFTAAATTARRRLTRSPLRRVGAAGGRPPGLGALGVDPDHDPVHLPRQAGVRAMNDAGCCPPSPGRRARRLRRPTHTRTSPTACATHHLRDFDRRRRRRRPTTSTAIARLLVEINATSTRPATTAHRPPPDLLARYRTRYGQLHRGQAGRPTHAARTTPPTLSDGATLLDRLDTTATTYCALAADFTVPFTDSAANRRRDSEIRQEDRGGCAHDDALLRLRSYLSTAPPAAQPDRPPPAHQVALATSANLLVVTLDGGMFTVAKIRGQGQ